MGDAGTPPGRTELRRPVGNVSLVCLLVVASQLVADEPLIVGANRDEVLDRPSTAVTVLDPGPPRVVGGRDELSGGTWLAVNEHGVCAGLTNQPLGEAKDPTRRSRGEIPLALARHTTAAAAVDDLLERFHPKDYNGSWLLVGDRTSLYFVDFTGEDRGTAQALPPGLHVLENRTYGEPSLKVDLVRAALGEPLGADEVVAAFRDVLNGPSATRGRGATQRGQLCASRVVRHPLVVHRRACPGPRACRLESGSPTGRRAARPTRTPQRSGRRGPACRRPGRSRFSRAPTACSAGGAADRRRRRAARADRLHNR